MPPIDVEQAITIFIAIGGVWGGKELVQGVWKWFTGRQDRERAQLAQIQSRLDDSESKRRRIIEHAHDLRRIAISHGIPAEELPEFPG